MKKILLVSIVFSILLLMIVPGMAFAVHLNEENRGKAAYFFDCSGNGGGETMKEADTKKFIKDNNGVFHRCGYNWINQSFTGADQTGSPCFAHGSTATHKITDQAYADVVLGRFPGHFTETSKLKIGDYVTGDGQIYTPCGGPDSQDTHDGSFELAAGRGDVVDFVWHGGKMTCDNNKFRTTCGNPRGWEKIIEQFNDHLHNKIPELTDNSNTKLILRGYSWGGGAIAMVAAKHQCFGTATDCRELFTDVGMDLVWLVDPVGPNGLRRTITTTNGIHQYNECCVGDKVFDNNVHKALVQMQNSDKSVPNPSGPGLVGVPTDNPTVFGFVEKSDRIEHWMGPSPAWPGVTEISTHSGLCPGYEERCHGGIRSDTTYYDRGIEIIKGMNNKPVLDDITPVVIDEGQTVEVSLRATDKMPNPEFLSVAKASGSACPSGSEWSNTENQCMSRPTCPTGLAWSNTENQCMSRPTCPTGLAWSNTENQCMLRPSCPAGYGYFFFNVNSCYQDVGKHKPLTACPTGSSLQTNRAVHFCVSGPVCPTGTSIQTSRAQHFCVAGPTCESGLYIQTNRAQHFCVAGQKVPSDFTIEKYPELNLRAVESDDNLEIVSPQTLTGQKTNCVKRVGSNPAGCPADDTIIRQGYVVIKANDNGINPSKVTIQAEDNGFPCGNCTGDNKDRSFNAKGDWTQKSLFVTVNNIEPTPEFLSVPDAIYAGYDQSFLFSAADPSPIDQAAGFAYSVDWGDGNVESFGKAASGTLIKNGSFENSGTVFGNWNEPSGQFVTLVAGNTNLDPWEITSGTVDHVFRTWIAPDGSKSLDMSGDPSDGLGAITQTFDTIEGVTNYRVNFDVSANPICSPRIMGLNVQAGNTPLEHIIVSNAGRSPTIMNWEHKSYLFSTSGPTATINFASTDTSGCGVTLDNVVVEKVVQKLILFKELDVDHNYESAGTYTIILTVTDKDGGVSSAGTLEVVVSGDTPPVGDVSKPLKPAPTGDVLTAQELSIPDWVKNTAGWWSDNAVEDSDFTRGISYLIEEDVIHIPDLPASSEAAEEKVPEWVRNLAGWWSDDLTTDQEFADAIKFLVERGIIRIIVE